ncbi:helix-turn-helix transcriptional regulator [Cellulosimicrobium composti]|uniref:AAA family ATPase n=1 Tax=Cellulosimicrobium composti TaxID=2672572 RepID=A0ABX0BA26_9MICO|nr:helix-turn-helix transcriptional regulator [Cellulosimicrobium composti]NDO87906.1 AAA family ATPase [Cellulosimicrobium composti]
MLARHAERARLDEVLGRVREGRCSTLLLEGAAGVGKTTLLDHLVERADGVQVLTVSGIQSEVELAYAGLHRLVRPLLGSVPALPVPQRQALDVTFGLRDGPAPPRFLVALATLGLLAAASDAGPVVCVVDDAQWLDESTALALGFVARRLEAEPVALVLAARSPADLPHLRDVPRLEVPALGREAATRLLLSRVPGPIDPRVRDRVLDEAGGNPLAIVEAVRVMQRAEITTGIVTPALSGRPSELEEHFRRLVDTLPAPTRRLLLVAAAEPFADAGAVRAAAGVLGLDDSAAGPAAEAGLLDPGAPLRFRHPLVRSAVYRSAPPEAVRAAHRALADSLAERADGADPDLLAWHRGRACDGVADHPVAEDLARAAGRALARGDPAAAAALLRRAVELTDRPEDRAAWSVLQAEADLAAGQYDAATADLAAARRAGAPRTVRARATLTEARVAFARERGGAAVPLLLEAARQLAPVDGAASRDAYLEALSAALFAGRLADGDAIETVAAAWRAAPVERTGAPADRLLDALARVVLDGGVHAWGALRRTVASLAASDEPVSAPALWLASVGAAAAWDLEGWEGVSRRLVDLTRAAGDFSELPTGLSSLAFVRIFQGRLADATEVVNELDTIVSATGGLVSPYVALGTAAVQGREADVDALLVESIPDAVRRVDGTGVAMAHWAAALLNNGLGRYEAAHLWAARADALHHPLHATSAWTLVERVEAASRVRDDADAAAGLEALADVAGSSRTDWVLGVLARSRALVAGAGAEEHFAEAVDRLGRARSRLDYARACLLYGEWLRRRRRLGEARTRLGEAHELFDAMGATGFALRAAREAAAAGVRTEAPGPRPSSVLTPQEARVARLAGQGLTNGEIAARMFLSPRTVEYHLAKVFAKLQITSRHDLGDAP